MRLINTSTLELRYFVGSNIPKYAILSHCWGEDEITLQDYTSYAKAGPRFKKILDFCRLARLANHEWGWVDTCCIDKSSSAELSEAINSMFRWYQESKVCYAFLEDIPPDGSLVQCRWFTRGWTLQELLAPSSVEFYNARLEKIGDRDDLAWSIGKITKIEWPYLRRSGYRISRASMAQRMCWASGRVTTRVEDEAYCLLGIFDINMPLLYGEGPRAFIRLQEQILAKYDDESLLAWYTVPRMRWTSGILAESPSYFEGSRNVVPAWFRRKRPSMTLTTQGLEIHCYKSVFHDIFPRLAYCSGLAFRQTGSYSENTVHELELQCIDKSEYQDRPLCVVLQRLENGKFSRQSLKALPKKTNITAFIPDGLSKIVVVPAEDLSSGIYRAGGRLPWMLFGRNAEHLLPPNYMWSGSINSSTLPFLLGSYVLGTWLTRDIFAGRYGLMIWTILALGLKVSDSSSYLLRVFLVAWGQITGSDQRLREFNVCMLISAALPIDYWLVFFRGLFLPERLLWLLRLPDHEDWDHEHWTPAVGILTPQLCLKIVVAFGLVACYHLPWFGWMQLNKLSVLSLTCLDPKLAENSILRLLVSLLLAALFIGGVVRVFIRWALRTEDEKAE